MKEILTKYSINITLVAIYAVLVSIMFYYYPMPQLTWDSHFYIRIAMTDVYQNLRPSGYAHLLSFLHWIRPSMKLIILTQFLINLGALFILLHALKKVFNLDKITYLILGLIFILEPVALYHCIAVLSDLLFSAITLLYISTLLMYVHTKKYIFFLLNVFFVFCAIEVRLIGLFYSVFTCIVLLYYENKKAIAIFNCFIVLTTHYFIHQHHVKKNLETYGVAIFSPFSSWTHVNNSLFALPRIHIDPKYIEDKETSELHAYFSNFIDTTSFVHHERGSEYIWNVRGPVYHLKVKLSDSLQPTDEYQMWYWMANGLGKYGKYIQKNFPYEYFMGFMVPNTQTMITPHLGEMMDFYATPYNAYDSTVRRWYYKNYDDLKCRKDIYKEVVNPITDKLYKLRGALFLLCSVLGIYYYRRLNNTHAFVIMGLFVFTFYAAMLYSSWFMSRYLIPLYPLMAAYVILLIRTIYKTVIAKSN